MMWHIKAEESGKDYTVVAISYFYLKVVSHMDHTTFFNFCEDIFGELLLSLPRDDVYLGNFY